MIGIIWTIVSAILWYIILPLFTIIAFYLIFISRYENIRKKIFASIYEFLMKDLNVVIIPYKKEMFKELNETDSQLKHRQPLRILELGAGPGYNFQFYPENSKMIIVEPNRHFESLREKNLSQWPMLTMEKTVVGSGEDLSAIEDNSVDAVVATLVLCSVVDVDKVLKEIHRILKPGGKYYYLEHGIGERTRSQKWIQSFLNPIWKTAFDGCNLQREFDKSIQKHGLFHNINTIDVNLPLSSFHKTVVCRTICGSAQKLH
ncbi:hypothetical protein CHUAL_008284 [Chamberlinius hualienensis]